MLCKGGVVKSGSKVGLFIAGLIAGALLFAIAPVGAHHNDTNFKNRLDALETKVKKLTAKTSNLTANGDNYGGFVHSYFVWSHSDYGCVDGENAKWTNDGDGYVALNCDTPASATSAGSPTHP